MGRNPRSFVVLAAIGILAAACGGGSASPSPSTAPATSAAAKSSAAATANPNELSAEVISKGKAEGQVAFYTSMETSDAERVLAEFAKVYPEIKVQLNRKSSSKIITQFATEAKAGKYLADVLETGGIDLAGVINDGYTQPYADKVPAAKALPKSYTQMNGQFVNGRSAISTFAWNTKLVKAGEEPKTWQDLLDPKWKGKILIEAGDWDVMQGLAKGLFNNDEAKVKDYFTKLSANQPQLIDGHSEQLATLEAGQGAVGWGIRGDQVQGDIDEKKVPLAWNKSNVMLRLQGPVMAKGAPHPNATLVFLQWYLAKDGGQKALASIKRIPAYESIADPVYKFDKSFTSGPEDAKDLPKYQKLWNELVAKK